MELALLDWVIIIAFLGLSLYIGLKFKDQASGSLTDFFLGGRNLPWYIAGISMVATTFAADTPLAVSEMVSQNGISKNWLWWSFLTGGMFTTFFFARLWRRANILTELEFIQLRYSGKEAFFLRIFKSVYLGLFMNCMVIAWVNLAFMTLLETFFGLEYWDALFITGGVMVIAVIYSSLSGLLGVAITDSVQFFIALGGTIILAFLVIGSSEVGGISQLKSTLPADYFNFFPSISSGDGASAATTLSLSIGAFLAFVTIQWWASWYPGSEPGGGGYIAQRMMSAKTEKDSLKATLFFQIGHYCLRPWPWILVGLAAIFLYSPQYQMADQALAQQIIDLKATGVSMNDLLTQLQITDTEITRYVAYLYKPRLGYVYTMVDFLPTGLKGLLLVAFLAAYLSTISTQLNMGASFLVNDLYKPIKLNRLKEAELSSENVVITDKDEDEEEHELLTNKHLVFVSRLMTVALMVVGLTITTMIDSISYVWEFIMEAGAGLGAVLILRWFWWRINAWSEIAAMVFPFIGYTIGAFVLSPVMGEAFIENKGTYFFTVIFTTIGWIVVTLLTKPSDNLKLDSFFYKVKPMGWWKTDNTHAKFFGAKEFKINLINWIAAVVMTYSILFTTGYLLLQEWTSAIIWLVIGLIGLFTLKFSIQKLEW